MKFLKEIAIGLTYIYILLDCFLSDSKPFSVFIFYLIEIVILIVLYTIVSSIARLRHPKLYRKQQPLANFIIGIVPLIIFQYFIIGWISSSIDPNENFLTENLIFTNDVFFKAFMLIVAYSFDLFKIKGSVNQENFFKENLITKPILLTLTNILGIICVFAIGINSLLPVLTIMVLARLAFEFIFARKILKE